MKCKLLLLLMLCAFVTGLPKDKKPLGAESESESDESEEQNEIITTTGTPESKIIAVYNSTELEARISQAGDNTVIIYLMVTWCPFCKEINPTVEDIAAKMDNLVVLKVDRDNLQEQDVIWKYGLSNLPSVPRFIFIKHGVKIDEISGSDSEKLRSAICKYITPSKNRKKSARNSSKSSKDSSSESSDSSDE